MKTQQLGKITATLCNKNYLKLGDMVVMDDGQWYTIVAKDTTLCHDHVFWKLRKLFPTPLLSWGEIVGYEESSKKVYLSNLPELVWQLHI